MKKLLLTLMSVAAIGGMSAQPFHLISKDAVNLKIQNPELSGDIKSVDLSSPSHSTRVPESTLVGDWTFTLGDYYFEMSAQEDLELPYTAQIQPSDGFNFVLFQCMDESVEYNALPMAAIFDEDANVLSFPSGVYFGDFEGYKMYQYVFTLNPQTYQLTPIEELDVEYNPETGALSIPENSVIGWPAFVDGIDENQGWFWLYDMLAGVQDGINGVEGILDDFVGEPVYYNTLGAKVQNPQKGQIVIEKRGKNSRKVVF